MRISLVSSESLDTQRGAVYRCCRSTRDLGLMQGACEWDATGSGLVSV